MFQSMKTIDPGIPPERIEVVSKKIKFWHHLSFRNPLEKCMPGIMIPKIYILPLLSVSIDRVSQAVTIGIGWLNVEYHAQWYIERIVQYKLKQRDYDTTGTETF